MGEIQHQLRDAGLRNDLRAAERIIEGAATLNVSPVDILMGMIAPALYQVGEDWKRGTRSIAEEHRFTSYCYDLFNWVVANARGNGPDSLTEAGDSEILVVNAPGNAHTLAIRILCLWMWNKGFRARMVEPPPASRSSTH